MSPLPTAILSDVHLGAIPEGNARAFEAFLRHLPEMASRLLIAGDLFDYWFEYRTVVLRQHFSVLRRLAELQDGGLGVTLVGGNHDAWGGSFLREEIGIRLVDGPVVMEVGDRRVYVAHGDGLVGGDWGYRLLRRLIRNRLGTGAFRLLHPDLADHVVRRVSSTDARCEAGPDRESSQADRLSKHAERLLRDDPQLDLVVFGHSHRPELREVEPDRFYLNAGDWVHHCSYGLVDREQIELREWLPEGGCQAPIPLSV